MFGRSRRRAGLLVWAVALAPLAASSETLKELLDCPRCPDSQLEDAAISDPDKAAADLVAYFQSVTTECDREARRNPYTAARCWGLRDRFLALRSYAKEAHAEISVSDQKSFVARYIQASEEPRLKRASVMTQAIAPLLRDRGEVLVELSKTYNQAAAVLENLRRAGRGDDSTSPTVPIEEAAPFARQDHSLEELLQETRSVLDRHSNPQ